MRRASCVVRVRAAPRSRQPTPDPARPAPRSYVQASEAEVEKLRAFEVGSAPKINIRMESMRNITPCSQLNHSQFAVTPLPLPRPPRFLMLAWHTS